jgi:hypothetical protein
MGATATSLALNIEFTHAISTLGISSLIAYVGQKHRKRE